MYLLTCPSVNISKLNKFIEGSSVSDFDKSLSCALKMAK